MKKFIYPLLGAMVLIGCCIYAASIPSVVVTKPFQPVPGPVCEAGTTDFVSRFDAVTEIVLSDNGITVDGGEETAAVYTSHDIIYYENRKRYYNGRGYGEGREDEKHSAEEASAHTVVNIIASGTYRITGKLSAGQIRIDLGEDARTNPNAVVELILSDADITCTVAPAILFLNTYECDYGRSAENATPLVDTRAAGSNLILEGTNIVNGSHVAKIYKNQPQLKKLWKQDGAIYSYTSMNIFGPGDLDLAATNEGISTELHLTINGGNLRISAIDDGINVSEDKVSVVTINAGNLTLLCGLGEEGDGIDSNGYLVVNGGKTLASSHPSTDSGLDSDAGTLVYGGLFASYGSPMGWTSDLCEQPVMHLQFSSMQTPRSNIRITRTDGTEVYSVSMDEPDVYPFSVVFLSGPALVKGETYHVYVDGVQMAGMPVSQPVYNPQTGDWETPPGWGWLASYQNILLAPDPEELDAEFPLTQAVSFYSGLTPLQP